MYVFYFIFGLPWVLPTNQVIVAYPWHSPCSEEFQASAFALPDAVIERKVAENLSAVRVAQVMKILSFHNNAFIAHRKDSRSGGGGNPS